MPVAFIMKVVAEFVHEAMRHGFFVLLFGGRITNVHISLFWPYELSRITYDSPLGGFEIWQTIWIVGGGILVCLVVSWALQILLLLGAVKDWRLSSLILWLSFWSFLNGTGYLIIGGVNPFGDVRDLILKGILAQETSLLMGGAIFTGSFFSISRTLLNSLRNIGLIKDLGDIRIALCLFWLTVPATTAISCLGIRQPLPYLGVFTALSFIPVLVAIIAPPITFLFPLDN